MKALSVAELIAAEADRALERMAAEQPADPLAFLREHFAAFGERHPHLYNIANRASFMRLATASTQGES